MFEGMKVFWYFSGFPEDLGFAGLHVGYTCSFEVPCLVFVDC
jgi:hypothetical protein